jgi:hypothetical protein
MIDSRETVFALRWNIWAMNEAFQLCGSGGQTPRWQPGYVRSMLRSTKHLVMLITQTSDYNNSGSLLCKSMLKTTVGVFSRDRKSRVFAA